ncbi:hypothetical protein E1161_16085 [Saccharopolyspora aridisoli]|uniref:Uncharacterized protein n=1 Tax=Saccharopolyspora aridisoli TaxID=2530385 RepID=A0A4R4UXA4_9PSEU|nr:hypothetical protein [Saccharopolyspora aridisoli]TDC91459.1 hypothetical protein E1161_16085 [Saccharopolyspora aridisoli]
MGKPALVLHGGPGSGCPSAGRVAGHRTPSGCVLALAYAQRHPGRVPEMVLCALATGRRAETDLLTSGLGAIFPQAWERSRGGVPESGCDGDLADAYHVAHGPDPAVHRRARGTGALE